MKELKKTEENVGWRNGGRSTFTWSRIVGWTCGMRMVRVWIVSASCWASFVDWVWQRSSDRRESRTGFFFVFLSNRFTLVELFDRCNGSIVQIRKFGPQFNGKSTWNGRKCCFTTLSRVVGVSCRFKILPKKNEIEISFSFRLLTNFFVLDPPDDGVGVESVDESRVNCPRVVSSWENSEEIDRAEEFFRYFCRIRLLPSVNAFTRCARIFVVDVWQRFAGI